MSDKLKDLVEKRNQAVEYANAFNDQIDKENREYTSEEDVQWDSWNTEIDGYTDEIKVLEDGIQKRTDRQLEIEKRNEFMKQSKKKPIKPDASGGTRGNDDDDINKHLVDIPEEFRNDNIIASYRDYYSNQYSTIEYRDKFNAWLLHGRMNDELRALQADKDTAGGFLVTPEQFVMQLIKKVDDLVFVRQLGTTFMVPNADSLGAPALDNDPADSTWTAEIKTGSEDSTMDFDKRTLHPHPLAKRLKVSKKLLRASPMNVDGIVRDRLAYKFGITEEKAFLSGTGANQPLGVFVASAQGIDTGQDISTDNTITQIKADNLINCVYALKPQYRTNARWAFHRDAVKAIRKLKDGNGDYLWQRGLASGAPNTILDLPYIESEYVPNTFTTGLYVGILGDWSTYWIADALSMTIQVLTELYAETNQNGYIGRKETDGMPTLGEAFVRVTLA